MPRGPKPQPEPDTKPKSHFGSVDQLPNGRFRARYRDNGKLISAKPGHTFVTDKEAWTCLAAVETDLSRGQHVNPVRSQTKFSVVGDKWMEVASTPKEGTLEDYFGVYKSRVLPYWKDYRIGDITALDYLTWMRKLEKEGLAQSTRNNRRTVFSLVMKTAVQGRYILTNPCVGIGAGKADENPYEAIPLDPTTEIGALVEMVRIVMLEHLRGRDLGYDLAVWVPVTCGLRAGEVWALRAGSVDAAKGTIRVMRSVRRGRETLPKIHERRAVPIPPDLLERLVEFIKVNERQPGDYLFQSSQGCRVTHSNWSRDFYRPARRRLSLPNDPDFHTLRHTCATIYFDAGASAEIVARILGDKVDTIRRHYEHVYPEAFAKFTMDVNAVFKTALATMSGTDVPRVFHGGEVVDLAEALQKSS